MVQLLTLTHIETNHHQEDGQRQLTTRSFYPLNRPSFSTISNIFSGTSWMHRPCFSPTISIQRNRWNWQLMIYRVETSQNRGSDLRRKPGFGPISRKRCTPGYGACRRGTQPSQARPKMLGSVLAVTAVTVTQVSGDRHRPSETLQNEQFELCKSSSHTRCCFRLIISTIGGPFMPSKTIITHTVDGCEILHQAG